MKVSGVKGIVRTAKLSIKNIQGKQKSPKWEKVIAGFSSFRSNHSMINHSSGNILVAEVRDLEYAIKIAALSKALAIKYQCDVSSYNVYIERIDYWYWNAEQYWANKISSSVVKDATSRMYNHFTDGRIHDNSQPYHDQKLIKATIKTVIASIDTANLGSINDISVEGIRIGDLIYDTYLRSFHQPTIEAIDEKLLLAIEWALNIFYNFKAILSKHKIKFLINTYTAYLHFGIVTRLCLANGVQVYTLGSKSYIVQLISSEFPYHQINHTLFNRNKLLTEEQLTEAQKNLENRFSGHIDLATSYMRKTAFTNTPISTGLKELFKLNKRNIVVYTHDFYDSPHINRKLQFADFYQYLKQTLNALEGLQGTTVFIKTHPNGIEGNKEKTLELINEFANNKFIVLDEAVSNLHIIELKPDLIATARGTVCVEMAYWGIPTVALYDNLFSNFNFTHTCFSKEEYFDILKGLKEPVINFDKKEILSFYYQAYLHYANKNTHGIYHYLSACTENTFSDKYVNHLVMRKEAIFSDNLVNEFATLV